MEAALARALLILLVVAAFGERPVQAMAYEATAVPQISPPTKFKTMQLVLARQLKGLSSISALIAVGTKEVRFRWNFGTSAAGCDDSAPVHCEEAL